MEKFARKCDATGEGMNEGWYINNKYFKYQEDTDKEAQTIPNEESSEDVNYKDFDELYNSFDDEDSNDFCYWTTWEIEEGEEYFDEEGNSYED